MHLIFIQFITTALVIIIAGIFLTRFADKIAGLTGWGRLFVGSLLLAGATSLPELMVDLHAVKNNLPNLAVGDLLGSSLFNLLILALLDFSYPSAFRGTSFSPQFLHHSLAAVLTIVLTSIVGVGIASQLEISFFEVSVFGWAVFFVYLFGLRLIFIEGNTNSSVANTNVENSEEGSLSSKEFEPWARSRRRKLFLAFFGYVVSAVIILFAAPYLVEAADQIARETGLGHTFIGTTLVALATSLPELIATLAAFRIGAPDLALGNIFGSNAFNMVLFVPLDLLFSGSLFTAVRGIHAVTAFGVVIATGIAVIGQLYRKKERSRLTEPSSEIVVFVILLFLILLYVLKG